MLGLFYKPHLTRLTIILIAIIASTNAIFGQLVVNNSQTAQQLVSQILAGNGVYVTNVTYNGSPVSLGKFSNGQTTNLGMSEGVVLSTGSIFDIPGPNSTSNKTTNTLGGSDANLAALVPGLSINDAAVLEFDFVPMSDTLRFNYVFASEEYPEWVGSIYNDVFGFFVSGPNPSGGLYSNVNIATIPNTALPVAINNINNGMSNTGPCINCQYYVWNCGGSSIEFDGFTTELTSKIVVIPCTTYHIKIAIGDVGDHSFDSGIFLKRNSFTSGILDTRVDYSNTNIGAFAVEGCNNATVSFTLETPAVYNRVINFQIGGTATNGIDYNLIADSIIIPVGSDSVSFQIYPNADAIAEGVENIILIVETSSCSNDTIIINIHEYNVPEVTIISPAQVCHGDTISISSNSINGMPPYNLLWSNGLSTNHFNTILTSDTFYQLTLTDQCNTQVSDSVYLTVNPLPNINASLAHDSICSGNPDSLFASGGLSYTWSPSTFLNSINSSNVVSTPSSTTSYIVTGTDANGCKNNDTLLVNVLPLPNLSISASSSTICHGDSTLLAISGGTSYTWDNAASLSNAFISNPIALPSITTIYTVIGTALNGCKDSISKTIIVNPLPTITITANDTAICRGSSSILTATGASTYSWTPITNISAPTGSTVIATPTTNEFLFVSGTDANGCISNDSLEIIVFSNPLISVTPTDTSICDNSSTIIAAFGAFSYSWSPASAVNSTSGNTVLASPLSTTNIMVIGTDTNGCKDTAYSIISVSPSPVITPTNQSICFGDSAIISVNSTLPNTTYLWNTGTADSTLRVKPLSTTTYTVTATDPSGCVGMMSSNVTVNPLPIISTIQSDDTICRGENVTLTCSGTSFYTWSPSAFLSTNSGSSTIAAPDSSLEIIVVGYDVNSCSDTNIVSIYVNQLPEVSVSPRDSLVCKNSSISLSATGAATYSWSPATGLNSTIGATVIATNSSDINYIVTGTDINGCSSNDTVTLTVAPVISASASPAQICLGDSTVLSAFGNNGCVFSWSNGQTSSSFTETPIITTIYTVTGTDTIGCSDSRSVTVTVSLPPVVTVNVSHDTICKGETSIFTANGALTYSWSPSTGLNSVSNPTVNAKPHVSTIYQVVGTNGLGCTDTVLVPLHVHQVMNLTSTATFPTLCNGQTTLITASGAPTFLWSPSNLLTQISNDSMLATPTATTNFKIIGVDTNGCRDSIYRNIVVNSIPTLAINPATSNICQGKSKTLTASGAANYTWHPSGSLSSSNTATTVATPSITTTYTVVGTSSLGCIDSLHAIVNVNPLPLLTSNYSTQHICFNDTALISVSGADFYSWHSTNPSFAYSSDTLLYVPKSNEIYTIIGTTIYGCKDSTTIQVSVSPIPIIAPVNPSICPGESILITANSNLSPTTFTWSNGVVNDSILVSPPTTSTYILNIADTTGCSFDTSVTVLVNSLPLLSISPANPEICPGQSLSISSQGAQNYNWVGSSISVVANDTALFNPTITTNYTLIGITSSGCIDSLPFQLLVHPPANVSVNPSSSYICSGSSQTLVAQGCNSYSWSPSTGLSSTITDTVISTAGINTLYVVTGTDTNNCSDTALAWVRVYDNPVINPSNPWKCPEDSITLNAVLNNQANSYLWSNGDTTNSIIIANTTTTTYSVTVTYPQGCQKTTSTTSNVHSVIPVTASSSNYHICPGDTTTLTGVNATTYIWQPSSSLLSTSGSSVKAVPDSTSAFFLHGIDGHGCETIDTIIITVFPQPNMWANPVSQTICIGDTATINYGGSLTYSWTANPSIISNTVSSLIANPSTNQTYIVAGTDTNGCVDFDTSTVIVDPGSSLSITPQNPVLCQGDTLTLHVSGALTYTWAPNFWITNTTGDSAKIYPSSNIIYYVHGVSSNGCPSDTSVYVNVKRKPMITVTPSQDSICLGDTIKLIACGAGGAGNYVWSPSIAQSNTFGDTVYVSPSTTTTYLITGISTDNCYRSISANIKVNPIPIVQAIADTTEICSGDTIKIRPSGASYYSWTSTSSFNLDADTVISSPNITSLFNLIGTNIHGCSAKDSTLITVNQLPLVSLSAIDTTICFNDSTELIANGASSYLWQQSNIIITGIGMAITSPSTSTIYTVIGIDNNNCRDTDSIEIFVDPIPSIIASSSSSIVCDSAQVNLSAISNMSPTLYSWNTGDSVANFFDNPEISTTYIVEGENIFGCKHRDTVYVQVNNYPILTTNIIDSTICIGDQVVINAFSSINPVNFIWSNSSTSNSITVSPVNPTTYTIKISDSIGCADSTQVGISTKQKPTVTLTSLASPICFGDTAFFNATVNMAVSNYTYSFASPSSPSSFFKPNFTQNVWVKVTDSVGCFDYDTIIQQVNQIPPVNISATKNSICIGDSSILTASSSFQNISFLWNGGSTASSITAKPTANTTYSVQAIDTLGCTGNASKTITVYQLPLLNITSSDGEICLGDTITLSGVSSSVITNYNWNNSWNAQNQDVWPLATSNYSLTVTDNHGCKNSDTIHIIVNSLPIVEITPAQNTICEDDSIQFHVTSTNPIGSILWCNGSTIENPFYHPIATGNFNVVVTDTNGCFGFDTNMITVIAKPTVDITGDSVFCTADSTLITYSGTGTHAATYNWDFDGGTVLSGSGKNPHLVKYNSPGTYSVSLTVDENGCTSDPDSLHVIVFQTPIIDFIAIPLVSCESLLVHFTNLTPNIKTWEWNFGDPFTSNDTSSIENPSYIYNIQGSYSVSLQVMSNDNCPANAVINSMITVYPNPKASFGAYPVQTPITNGKITMWNFSDPELQTEWFFDDPLSGINNYSTEPFPWHQFQDTGIFNIRLVVTDEHGCTDTAYDQVAILPVAALYIPNAFTPNGDGLNDDFGPLGHDYDWSTFEFYIFNRWGEPIFVTTDYTKRWDGRINGEYVKNGVYNYLIRVKSKQFIEDVYRGSVTVLR